MSMICKLRQLSEQTLTVYEGSDYVKGCYRNVVLTDLNGNKDFNVVLTGDDAFIPLKEGQRVLADIRGSSHRCNGEWYEESYVLSIKPLEDDVKIEYVKDWTMHVV